MAEGGGRDHGSNYAAAAVEALGAFGISGDLTLVSISENVTFRVAASDADFVLRLHRPGYHSLDELDSESLWLDALDSAGIAVPRPLKTLDGRSYVPVSIPGGDEVRYVGMSRWVDGQVVQKLAAEDRGSDSAHFAQLGSLMASMHNQASTWEPPKSFRRHRLDVDGLLGDRPFWGQFWENPRLSGSEQAILIETRDRAGEILRHYGTDRRTFSMIHADLHLGNLLISQAGDLSIIDFDDAGFGWHQYDIAVALFHSRDELAFDGAEEIFLDAYRTVRPIADADLALVPMFEMIRSMALIGWTAQRLELNWPDATLDAMTAQTIGLCTRFTPPPLPLPPGN